MIVNASASPRSELLVTKLERGGFFTLRFQLPQRLEPFRALESLPHFKEAVPDLRNSERCLKDVLRVSFAELSPPKLGTLGVHLSHIGTRRYTWLEVCCRFRIGEKPFFPPPALQPQAEAALARLFVTPWAYVHGWPNGICPVFIAIRPAPGRQPQFYLRLEEDRLQLCPPGLTP